MFDGRFYRLLGMVMAVCATGASIVGLMNDYVFDATIVFVLAWVVVALLFIAGELSDLGDKAS